ncbi:MAG: hypothetical protein LBD81_01360 [Holosporaceae bacterium]|nr:hypothetical protein [Holosporaceae bacterium]
MKIFNIKDIKVEIAILAVMCLVFNAISYVNFNGLYISFFDTDDYMRLVRIQEFFKHFDLSNNVIERSNVPFGCSLHWTRLYDFFIIIPSYILSFFTGSIDKAIEYVAFCISPVVKIANSVVLFRIASALLPRTDAFLCAAIYISHILLLPSESFGRPDHHAFIRLTMLIFIDGVIGLLSALDRNESPLKLSQRALWLAAAMTLCLWTSPETMIPILLVNAVLFAATLYYRKGLSWLLLANLITTFFIGTIILDSVANNLILFMLIMAIVALISIFLAQDNRIDIGAMAVLAVLMIMIPFTTTIAAAEYDKISIVHFAFFACGSIFFGFSAFVERLPISVSVKNKILLCVAASIVLVSVFLFSYPKFIYGMEADISKHLKEIWLSKVYEMQSPFSSNDTYLFLSFALVTVVAVYNKIMELARNFQPYSGNEAHSIHPEAIVWWILVANTICYLVLGGISFRMLPHAAVFGLPMVIDLGMNGSFIRSFNSILRIMTTFLMSIGIVFITTCMDYKAKNKIEEDKETPNSKNDLKKNLELLGIIDSLSAIPVVIMAGVNDGPELLYRTKHSVVAAPYHRQGDGIIASHEVLHGKFDENRIKKILETTKTAYIFIRKSDEKPSSINSLSGMVNAGSVLPSWLNVVKIPDKFEDVVLLKVNIKAMSVL